MKVCCSSPASICFWLIASFVAWAVLAMIGWAWHPLHASAAATCLLAIAAGCFANAIKNTTYHCIITAPLFLAAAVLDLTSSRTHIPLNVIWVGVFVGVTLAFLLEWRYARKPACD
jgi:hypothetical protein